MSSSTSSQTREESALSSQGSSTMGSPFDLLDHDDLLTDDDSDTSDDASAAGARGSLTPEHLDPIASRHWKTVLSWITFHPDDLASLRDREGQTALHHACLFRAPLNVIEAMLFAAPEIAMVGNDEGELALHWAVRLALPSQVITILLDACPKSSFVNDERGQSPHLLLWDRHEDTVRDVFRIYGRERALSFPCWKRIMMLVTAHGNANGVNVQDYPLHAIAQCPCESSFLQFTLSLLRDQIDRVDDKGYLPLHLACVGTGTQSIKLVLASYNEAAFMPNTANGRLPLHLAVRSGKSWDQGLDALFAANPAALGYLDDGLYPFMLAAAVNDNKGASVSTVYSLLRSNPEYVRLY